ncbi:MAG: hypothetical protein JST89_19850 [Cyanobacteria bacterium SZAS-4]|nr:hypothetical protein [Cyanobacteria bacterium SZAS-4]
MSYHPSEASVDLQRTSSYYTLVKAANTIGYLFLLHLSWRFLTHRYDWQLSTGCVILSGCWLILTRIKVDHLLQTYFDILSRIELQLPVVFGLVLGVVALMSHAYHPIVHVIAVGEMAFWVWIWILFRKNKSKFKRQGYGPVPLNTWVNPPADVLQPGDLILTSGNIAKELHESVGHAEMVLGMPDGRKMLFSSYMDKGTCFHPIEELTGPGHKGHYIALHLKHPWSEEKAAKATEIAESMVALDRQWAAEENIRVSRRIAILPLPESIKAKLRRIFHASGYDWFGTFMGRVVDNRWTCIGACVELYQRMDVPINHYGTGLLGVGTTIFDPILPVRFLADPAFELVTKIEEPKVALEKSIPHH